MIFEVTPGPGELSSGREPRILRRSACSALCAGIDHPVDGAGEYHYYGGETKRKHPMSRLLSGKLPEEDKGNVSPR